MSWDWWINDGGVNTLKGIEDDPDNPIRLDDEMIAYLLTTIREARDGFNYMYPLMLSEEQERLDRITVGLPQFVALDHKKVDDDFQKIQNVEGIHTAGPRGGKPIVPRDAPVDRKIVTR